MTKVINFVKESIDEIIYKVTWPKYNELQSSSFLVLVASLIFAFLIFIMDFVFENGMESIYEYF